MRFLTPVSAVHYLDKKRDQHPTTEGRSSWSSRRRGESCEMLHRAGAAAIARVSLVDSQPLPVTIPLPPDSKDATMGAKVRVDLADDDRDRGLVRDDANLVLEKKKKFSSQICRAASALAFEHRDVFLVMSREREMVVDRFPAQFFLLPR